LLVSDKLISVKIHTGLKEAEDEVEKFVQANTQEVAKDKWQCPLCGKKFKAAEFVHKHILHKHAEKVKEVKKEVSSLMFITCNHWLMLF
jgi:DNA repair exonuclease SbcCD ATPase subunit